MRIKKATILKHIERQFIKECAARNATVSPEFTHYFIHILARDISLGINWQRYSVCAQERLLQNGLALYFDPIHPIMNIIKLKYFYMNCKGLTLEGMRQMYEEDYHQKLEQIVHNIMQYPETSNEQQLKKMRQKMCLYIVVAYDVGDPANHALLERADKCLRCVLGPNDLQTYVVKKRYHRLEYLQRLAATVCGILVFNAFDPESDREPVRDMLGELQMARQNTKIALDDALKDNAHCISTSTATIDKLVKLDYENEVVHCQWPLEKIRHLNKFTVLFYAYEDLLMVTLKRYERAVELLDLILGRKDCVFHKIQETIKYRNAVDSDSIYPHFKYFTELWVSMVIHVRHFIELNKALDTMASFVNGDVKDKFFDIIHNIEERRKVSLNPIDIPFLHKPSVHIIEPTPGCSLKPFRKDQIKKYCAATIALTNGLLMLSTVEKKLCEDSPLIFGFRSMESAKLAEKYFFKLKENLIRIIYTSASLIVIFDLEDVVLQQDAEEVCECLQCECSTQSMSTQTEMVVKNDVSLPSRLKTSLNIWDFHRQTITLANVRKMQTKAPQTDITFGKREAKLQTFKTMSHHI